MFQRLLICTDFTDGLQRLVQFVPSLAAGGIRQIVFLHVVPIREDVAVPRPNAEKIERAQAKLAPALQQAPTGIEVKVEVQSGRAIDAILRTAKNYQSDVILLGTVSRNLLTEKLFGSTTAELAQKTSIPLLALRPQMMSTYTSEELNLRCRHLFRYLLLPFDNSEASQYSIEQIETLAKTQPDGELRYCQLCWVFEEGGRFEVSEPEQQRLVREVLEPIRDRLQAAGLTVEISARRGNSVAQVLLAAQEADVSAIALSSNVINRLLGSTHSFAGELLRRSWHPVLFFPTVKGDTHLKN